MPQDELVRFWRRKEKNKEVDKVEYIQVVKANMELVREMAREKEEEDNDNQKFYDDRKTTERKFIVGDNVLVFWPRKTDKLLNKWHSPFIVTQQITEVTYRVDMARKVKNFHINALKPWTSPEPAVFMALEEEHNDNASTLDSSINVGSLSPLQQSQLTSLQNDFADVIQDVPGRTSLVSHEIETGDSQPIRLPPYRLAHSSQEALSEEIRTLLHQVNIETSRSPWASPIVLVTDQEGGKLRMCVDYRKLNAITRGDPYPLPNIEEMINSIGKSPFITTLDLTKGSTRYQWQKVAGRRRHL